MTPTSTAYVALGSNLGDREAAIRAALRALDSASATRVRRVSTLRETEPVGPPQPRYLNAAVLLRTELEAEALLAALLGIEKQLGRVRKERWGPRAIDLDILWLDGAVHRSPALTVPHPSLRERPFALRPLLDVAPAARDPADGVEYAAVLASLDAGGVQEIPESRATW